MVRVPRAKIPYTLHTQTPESGQSLMMSGEEKGAETPPPSTIHNPLTGKDAEENRGWEMTPEKIRRCWIQTRDFHRVTKGE